MSKKDIRKAFTEGVLQRDGMCLMCGKKDVKLDAHHITDRHEMPNGGYVLSNGITLCDTAEGCHLKAERWHISGNREWVEGYHPDQLYSKIGSSYEKAFEESEKLKFSI